MEQSNRPSNSPIIEELRQKLATYKQTIETLNSREIVEDYLLSKNEGYEMKKLIGTLEGEINSMKDKEEKQIGEYEETIKSIFQQIDLVNNSMQALKQDVAFSMSKVSDIDFSALLKKIDIMVDIQYTFMSTMKERNNELSGLKDEISQIKKQVVLDNKITNTSNSSLSTQPQPSSFRQLQNILQSSKNIQSLTNEGSRINHKSHEHITMQQRNKQLNQGISFEDRHVKSESINTNIPTQSIEIKKMNSTKNKIKMSGSKSSFSFKNQTNKKQKNINQGAIQTTSKAKLDENTTIEKMVQPDIEQEMIEKLNEKK